MAEATQTEIQTITINEKVYRSDSITENGGNIINDVQKIDGELGRLNLQMSIARLAKQKLIEELEKEIPNFVEVEVEGQSETKEA